MSDLCFKYEFILTPSTGKKRKIRNDNVCLRRESNQQPLAFHRAPLTTLPSGQILVALANTYIQHKQINFDADKSTIIFKKTTHKYYIHV